MTCVSAVQLRAWEAALGATYEQARAVGGRFGFSRIVTLTTTSSGTPFANPSFSLRAGLPIYGWPNDGETRQRTSCCELFCAGKSARNAIAVVRDIWPRWRPKS